LLLWFIVETILSFDGAGTCIYIAYLDSMNVDTWVNWRK